MAEGNEDDNLLLGIIPSFRRTPEQVASWCHVRESPTYKLLRDPIHLDELNEYNHELVIWRENRTLTYVVPRGVNEDHRYPNDERRTMTLRFGDEGLVLYITGETDDSVAETAAYFMNFEGMTEDSTSLVVVRQNGFDFRAVSSHCLERLFEVAPSRHINIQAMMLNVDQMIVFATRPHPIQLTFFECHFEDQGTAFVDALESPQSSFGALTFVTGIFNDYNMKRLFQVDVIEHLELPFLHNFDEIGLLHLSAKVESLDCFIYPPTLMTDLSSLNIVARKLSLNFDESELERFPAEPVLSLFRRIAELGHFVELDIRFCFYDCDDFGIPACVVQAVISAALANVSLQVLDLRCDPYELQWSQHSATLFEGLKDHGTLLTLRIAVDDEEEAFGPDLLHIQRLINHKRNITVTNSRGDIYTDGFRIDEIYSFNRFYHGSKGLVAESISDLSLLVATTLAESASSSFQRCAVLMADHFEALHELIQFAQLEELDDESLVATVSIGSTSNDLERADSLLSTINDSLRERAHFDQTEDLDEAESLPQSNQGQKRQKRI